MIPKSYRTQDGCHNCRYVYIKHDIDESPEYFCHLDNSPRPMDDTREERWPNFECRTNKTQEQNMKLFIEYSDRWNKWAEAHGVNWAGTCNEWQMK